MGTMVVQCDSTLEVRLPSRLKTVEFTRSGLAKEITHLVLDSAEEISRAESSFSMSQRP